MLKLQYTAHNVWDIVISWRKCYTTVMRNESWNIFLKERISQTSITRIRNFNKVVARCRLIPCLWKTRISVWRSDCEIRNVVIANGDFLSIPVNPCILKAVLNRNGNCTRGKNKFPVLILTFICWREISQRLQLTAHLRSQQSRAVYSVIHGVNLISQTPFFCHSSFLILLRIEYSFSQILNNWFSGGDFHAHVLPSALTTDMLFGYFPVVRKWKWIM